MKTMATWPTHEHVTIGRHREAGLESQWLFAMTEVTE
jgi:hypothetical protein